MTQQQKAEAYVRKQIPELMELSFGCVLYRLDGSSEYRVITDLGFGANNKTVWVASNVRGSFAVNWKDTHEVPKQEIQDTQGEAWKIIGHPIQLQHWLRVLEKCSLETFKRTGTEHFYVTTKNCLCMNEVATDNEVIVFNLTTGQPATEADYETFNSIVGNT